MDKFGITSTTVDYADIKAALGRMESAFALSSALAPDTLEYSGPDWVEVDDDGEWGVGDTEDAEDAEDAVIDALGERGFSAAMTTLLGDPTSFSVSMRVVIDHFVSDEHIWLIESYMAYLGQHLRHETLIFCYRLGLIPAEDMTDEIRLLVADAATAWDVVAGSDAGFIVENVADAAFLYERLAARVENMNVYTEALGGLDAKVAATIPESDMAA